MNVDEKLYIFININLKKMKIFSALTAYKNSANKQQKPNIYFGACLEDGKTVAHRKI